MVTYLRKNVQLNQVVKRYYPGGKDETVFSYGIKLTQRFSFEEKVEFMKAYLKYRLNKTRITLNTEKDLLNILDKLPLKDLVNNIPMKKLKLYIENLIELHIKLEKRHIAISREKIR